MTSAFGLLLTLVAFALLTFVIASADSAVASTRAVPSPPTTLVHTYDAHAASYDESVGWLPGRVGAHEGSDADPGAMAGSATSQTEDSSCACSIYGFGVAAKAESGAVKAYDVGTYRGLKARSVVGDQLDIHHVPQAQPGRRVISGYVYKDAPAIALPAEEHALIPNLKGEYSGTPEDLISHDLGNLRDFTNAPAGSIQNLRDLIRGTYPGTYGGR